MRLNQLETRNMKLETLTRDTLHEERAVGRFRPSTVLGTLSFVEGRRTVMNNAGVVSIALRLLRYKTFV